MQAQWDQIEWDQIISIFPCFRIQQRWRTARRARRDCCANVAVIWRLLRARPRVACCLKPAELP
jgi:hypothetical protein